jgi:hypothetical protein
MPQSWIHALNAYRYPVKLSDFSNAGNYPGWFENETGSGDRDATEAFEDRFRKLAPQSIEAWIEVVFWKLHSMPLVRNGTTRQVAEHFVALGITADRVYTACLAYTERPDRPHFDTFRQLFGFRTESIAVVATFPAFLRPKDYPMADRRTAKWVQVELNAHNAMDVAGPHLITPPFLNRHGTVLTMADFEYMQSWVAWCRRMARRLSEQTNRQWRARDVEMAVFYAWGDRGPQHPTHHLNAIGPSLGKRGVG